MLKDFPCKINLIPFNTFAQSDYRRPSGNAVSRFWKVLVDSGHRVTVRTTRGDDIDAAPTPKPPIIRKIMKVVILFGSEAV